jgi:hypothetical protein
MYKIVVSAHCLVLVATLREMRMGMNEVILDLEMT